MKYFILKTEPSSYSYDMLEKEGKTVWDGVKNPLAQKFIKSVEPGDMAYIYHTGDEKAIVALAKIVSLPYQDSSGLFVFDVVPVRRLKRKITLSEIKSNEAFKDFYLVKMPRLSVMEVPEHLVKVIESLEQSL
jgi:predicted RNA-binding protein with PUA-like domain